MHLVMNCPACHPRSLGIMVKHIGTELESRCHRLLGLDYESRQQACVVYYT